MTIDKDSSSFKEFNYEFKTKLNSALLNKLTEIKKEIASKMIGEQTVLNEKKVYYIVDSGNIPLAGPFKSKKAAEKDKAEDPDYKDGEIVAVNENQLKI